MIGGGILSFAGLIYLVSGGHPADLVAQGVHLGDALMLVAALVYALYGGAAQALEPAAAGLAVNPYMQAICALMIMFPAFLATPAPLRQLDARTLPLIAYAGGLASVVLPFFRIRGIERLGPSRCAIFMNLLPVLTALGAIVMLGEPVRAYHLIGGGIHAAGCRLCAAIPPAAVAPRQRAREPSGCRLNLSMQATQSARARPRMAPTRRGSPHWSASPPHRRRSGRRYR